MIISTKGRYALHVMVDLAEHGGGAYIALKDVAARQGASQKYLEAIMAILSKNGLVDAQHGKSGGYRLNRSPEEYNLGELLRLTEGSLAPVACVEDGAECHQANGCKTLPVWDGLNRVINEYLDGVTLADLLESGEDAGAET